MNRNPNTPEKPLAAGAMKPTDPKHTPIIVSKANVRRAVVVSELLKTIDGLRANLAELTSERDRLRYALESALGVLHDPSGRLEATITLRNALK